MDSEARVANWVTPYLELLSISSAIERTALRICFGALVVWTFCSINGKVERSCSTKVPALGEHEDSLDHGFGGQINGRKLII